MELLSDRSYMAHEAYSAAPAILRCNHYCMARRDCSLGYVLDAAFVSVSAVCGYAFRAHQNRKKPASVSLDAGK